MKKSLFIHFSLIFLALIVVSLVLYMTVNMMDFYISEALAIPIYMYIIYGIGSVLGILVVSLVSRKKNILLGILIWLLITLLIVMGYISISKWSIFINNILNVFLEIPTDFVGGFFLAIIFMSISLILSNFIDKIKDTKSTAPRKHS